MLGEHEKSLYNQSQRPGVYKFQFRVFSQHPKWFVIPAIPKESMFYCFNKISVACRHNKPYSYLTNHSMRTVLVIFLKQRNSGTHELINDLKQLKGQRIDK